MCCCSPNRGHYVPTHNIAGFDAPDYFKDDMDSWLQIKKITKPAPGDHRVLVAGQPEAEIEAVHRKDGIPLHPEWSSGCAELPVRCLFLDSRSVAP